MANRDSTTSRFAFNSGEVTQKLSARSDLAKSSSSARTIQNMKIIAHGAVDRRPGLQFIVQAKV